MIVDLECQTRDLDGPPAHSKRSHQCPDLDHLMDALRNRLVIHEPIVEVEHGFPAGERRLQSPFILVDFDRGTGAPKDSTKRRILVRELCPRGSRMKFSLGNLPSRCRSMTSRIRLTAGSAPARSGTPGDRLIPSAGRWISVSARISSKKSSLFLPAISFAVTSMMFMPKLSRFCEGMPIPLQHPDLCQGRGACNDIFQDELPRCFAQVDRNRFSRLVLFAPGFPDPRDDPVDLAMRNSARHHIGIGEFVCRDAQVARHAAVAIEQQTAVGLAGVEDMREHEAFKQGHVVERDRRRDDDEGRFKVHSWSFSFRKWKTRRYMAGLVDGLEMQLGRLFGFTSRYVAFTRRPRQPGSADAPEAWRRSPRRSWLRAVSGRCPVCHRRR
nr:hypothetical protein SHINE37_50009 [Rhizobiaceae bacterium]